MDHYRKKIYKYTMNSSNHYNKLERSGTVMYLFDKFPS